METIEIRDIFYLGLHFLVIGLLLRSTFFLFKARNKMPLSDFLVLIIPVITGVGWLSYKSNDLDSVIDRFPWMIMFLVGSANAFYMLAKSRKETAFSIHNYIMEEYTDYQKTILHKLGGGNTGDNGKIPDVTFSQLLTFPVNKTFVLDLKRKKEAIIRKDIHFPNTIKFMAYLLKDGVFGEQTHSDADETIYVEKGLVQEIYSGVTYKEGDTIKIPANTIHGFIGLSESSTMRAYLTKV